MAEPLKHINYQSAQHGPNSQGRLLNTIGLVLPGGLLMFFGLPMVLFLPYGLIFGKRNLLDLGGVAALVVVALIGAIFVYAGALLLTSAARTWRGDVRTK